MISRFLAQRGGALVSASSRTSGMWYMNSASFAEASGLTAEGVQERVQKVVKQFHKVDPKTVTNTSNFTNDLGLDSLDAVELLLAVEDEFCIVIPDSDADQIQSVDAAVSYILTNPNAK